MVVWPLGHLGFNAFLSITDLDKSLADVSFAHWPLYYSIPLFVLLPLAIVSVRIVSNSKRPLRLGLRPLTPTLHFFQMTAFRFAFVALCFWSCCGSVRSQTIACEGGSVLIDSGTEALTFQWQSSEDGNWTNLEEVPPFFGTSSSGLLIDPASTLLQGMSFRCLVPSVDSELPDSTAFVTELSVVNSLEPSVIEVGPLSSTSSNCHGDNSVLLVQTAAQPAGEITTHCRPFQETAEHIHCGRSGIEPHQPHQLHWFGKSSTLAPAPTPHIPTFFKSMCMTLTTDPLPVHSKYAWTRLQTNWSRSHLQEEAAPTSCNGNPRLKGKIGGHPGGDFLVFASEPVSESTSYRLVVTDANGCGAAVSSEVSIDVFPPLSPATIAWTPPCPQAATLSGQPTDSIQTAPASGTDGNINSEWQQLLTANGYP